MNFLCEDYGFVKEQRSPTDDSFEVTEKGLDKIIDEIRAMIFLGVPSFYG